VSVPDVLVYPLLAALVSLAFTKAAMELLPRVGLISLPDANHPRPVPVGGGIAVWMTSAAALIAMAATGHGVGGLGVVFAGATVLFLAGLWDDIRLLDPRTKLLVQVGAAALMVVDGVTFPLGPQLEWVAVPVTILWFVGVTNAFNLIDNMDGMLPGVAAVAAFFVGLFTYATGRPETALLSWVVAGACVGFLPWNLPPARIFLGDSGSMFLGFLLAGLAIGESWAGLTTLGFTILAPALLLAVPIFNTTFVTVTRKLSGIPVSRGKADHINYRLLAHGLSRGRALAAVYVASAVSGTVGVLVVTSTPLAYGVGATLFLLLLMYLGVYLYQGRVGEFERDFNVERTRPGWEESPWYRWVIRVFAVAGDVALVFAAAYAAFFLRFDGRIPVDQLGNLAAVLPYLIVFRVGIALFLGVYETQWHHGMARDAVRLAAVVALGSLLFASLLFVLRLPSFPRTVIVLEGILSLCFFALTRLGVRALGEVTSLEWGSREGRRTIIAGSSDGVLTVFRALRGRSGPGYQVIGFADDDPTAHKSLVGGVRVLGPASRITALARLYGAEHVIFTFPYLDEEQLSGLVRAVLESGLTAEVARLEVLGAGDWLRRQELPVPTAVP
jgi:UDP-GlcNAc:undecaprenyl-phosphate GlcNAc-1-phosphate transferase